MLIISMRPLWANERGESLLGSRASLGARSAEPKGQLGICGTVFRNERLSEAGCSNRMHRL